MRKAEWRTGKIQKLAVRLEQGAICRALDMCIGTRGDLHVPDEVPLLFRCLPQHGRSHENFTGTSTRVNS